MGSTAKNDEELIPCEEKDFLKEDPAIRGQKYVCLSFLSPEDILPDKDVFMFEKFLGNFSEQMNTLFQGLEKRYPEEIDGIKAIRENVSYIFDN